MMKNAASAALTTLERSQPQTGLCEQRDWIERAVRLKEDRQRAAATAMMTVLMTAPPRQRV